MTSSCLRLYVLSALETGQEVGKENIFVFTFSISFFFFFFNGVLFFDHLFTSLNGSLLESTHTPYKCFLKFPAGVRWGGGLMH